MGNIFKSKAPKQNLVTEQDKAILQIKQQRDKVKQFQKKLVVQLESETDLIRQLVQKEQKQKALLLLRKKKYTEKILDKTDNELHNIETLITQIEFKMIEENVIKGIQIGNEAMKQLNAVFNIEQIGSILEETEEGVRKQQEISDLISGYKEEENEEALDRELESILENEIQLPEAPQGVPDEKVGTEEPKAKKTEKAPKKVLVEA